MGVDVYGEIYYGVIVGELPWDEESDIPGYIDKETEEIKFEMEQEGAHLLTLGSAGGDNFILGFEVLESYWGQPVEINSETITLGSMEEWDASIKERLEILGLPFTTPKFYLSAYFSY